MIVPGPLWFLNTILFFFNITLVLFLGFTFQEVLIPLSIKTFETQDVAFSLKSEIVNIENISERDIFDTSTSLPKKKELVASFKKTDLVSIIYPPEVPEPKPLERYIVDEQELLPPLSLALNGTIIQNNPMKNRAILENTRTKLEKSYSIGDVAEDGQIIYISKDKVVFVRSNGQEEAIYLHNAFKIEDETRANTLFKKIIKKASDGVIHINKELFKYKVKTVSSFIDQLGLVTYFQNNDPVGCIIQNAPEDSLGFSLGFIGGDVITSVNEFPTNSMESRLKIFDMFQEMKEDDPFQVSVNFMRNQVQERIIFQIDNVEEKNRQKMGIIIDKIVE